MLTAKMREILEIIEDGVARDGVPPSYDEMREKVGLRSKSGVARVMRSLEERGFIRTVPHRARAVEVLRPSRQSLPGGREIVVGGTRIPFLGAVSASTPSADLADRGETVPVPPDLVPRSSGFAVRMAGDAMIEAGLIDGDLLVMDSVAPPRPGVVVLAVVDGEEAMVARWRRRLSDVVLSFDSSVHADRIFSFATVEIRGVLAGMSRSYRRDF